MNAIPLIVGFLLIAFAARQVGRYATFARFPLITGYLAAGAVVGPFGLGWISREAVDMLRPVDTMALAFIAFAAGRELYIKEIRSRMRSILWTTAGLVASTFTLGCIAVMLLAERISFMAAMPRAGRLGVALMAAAILVARSPSSAIAIVSELRARGPFTKTALGVTVVMDAVVILTFAISLSLAHALVDGRAFEVTLLLHVLVDLFASFGAGYVLGWGFQHLSVAKIPLRVKTVVFLLLGYGVFVGASFLKQVSLFGGTWRLHFEALLICMIAGIVVTNARRGRDEFSAALDPVAPGVYVAFFTLVGASLALDTLAKLWKIAVMLFGVRLLGINVGTQLGGTLAGDPKPHRRMAWMAYVTQAGVGLGLAKDAASEFSTFGADFATLVIAIIVINQIVGPPLFKAAIKRMGEAHLAGSSSPDEVRDALIVGVDDQSLALAQHLSTHNWKVIMADPDPSRVERLAEADVEAHHVLALDGEALSALITRSTDAVVAMLADDEENFKVCELAYEKHGVQRIIVRLHDLSWSDRFADLGAHVVEPASAMVNLLDQFVRAPNTAALLLHRSADQEIVQITIDDPDLDSLPLNDLRLPLDVRVLEIVRGGQSIVPQGNTELRLGDDVTFVGKRELLEDIVARWGY